MVVFIKCSKIIDKNNGIEKKQLSTIMALGLGTEEVHRLQLFSDSFRDHQVKCVSHNPKN